MLQTPKPFFSDDFPGTLRVIGTFGSLLLVMVGMIVKWGQSSFKDKLDKTSTDLAGLGEKVDRIDKSCIERTTKEDELRERVAKQEYRSDTLIQEHGEFRAGIDALEKQVANLQGSMLIAMNDAMNERDRQIAALRSERDRQVADLRVEIASLRERDKTRDIVREMLRNSHPGGGD